MMKRTIQVLAPALAILFSISCGDSCRNELITRALSPDRSLQAIVFQRDCGATTGFSTHVSVVPVSEEFLEHSTFFKQAKAGNAFIADTNNGTAASGAGGGPIVRVEWLAPKRLRILHDSGTRIFSSEKTVNGVDLEYSVAETAQ